jgi:hypothetical protein
MTNAVPRNAPKAADPPDNTAAIITTTTPATAVTTPARSNTRESILRALGTDNTSQFFDKKMAATHLRRTI